MFHRMPLATYLIDTIASVHYYCLYTYLPIRGRALRHDARACAAAEQVPAMVLVCFKGGIAEMLFHNMRDEDVQ